MARQCEVCGKQAFMGNRVTTRGKAKYLGGVGTKVTGIARRAFKPNLQRVKVTVGRGTNTSMLVCARCIRSGAVTKLVRRAPFKLTMEGGKGAKAAAS
jgi:large subunit ribosomal protein L28